MMFNDYYTVKRGDSLTQIAIDRGLCSKSKNWPSDCLRVADKIQSLNPTLIKNVNLIQPGWKLQMPADSPTVAPAASKKPPSSGNGKRIALGILSMLGVGAALVFSKKGKKASSAA